MNGMFRDLLFSLRQIRRQPVLSLAIVLTLALAIGANTAIFSYVSALLIRPFPFKDPDQLVEIYSIRGGERGKISMPEIQDIQRRVTTLESIAAHKGGAGGYNYSGDGHPEEWKAVLTTGNLFEVLGVSLTAGQKWPDHTDRQRDYRVILSYDVWQTSFGGRADIIGRTISLDHAPGYTIDGVTGRDFDFPHGIQVYRSIGGFTNYQKRDARDLIGIARIKRPAGLERFQAELDSVSRQLAEEHPDINRGLTFQAISFREMYAGGSRPFLMVLFAAVGLILLIACCNVVNLLLSRALSREQEMAIRVALGANRRQLMGQLLTESLVLALIAAGFGLALAWSWMKLIQTLIGSELPQWMTIALDGRVLLFNTALSLLAGILSGLAPAFRISSGALPHALKEGSRGSTGGRNAERLRDMLTIGELALAFVLLAGAGMLIQSFVHLQSQQKGFDSNSIATFRVALGWKRYSGDAVIRYYEQALDKLAGIAGHPEIALSTNPPLARQEEDITSIARREGQSVQEGASNPYVRLQVISENYFDFAHIPMKSGRIFSKFDHKGSEPVIIISQRLAKLFWPDTDPIGQRLTYDPSGANQPIWRKIVGVAGNVQNRELGGESGLDIYMPFRQQSGAANQYVLARTKLGLAEFTRLAEQAMWSIDSEQSVFDFQTWDERILNGIWQLRVSKMLLMMFALVALALATIGIYGVMSYLVGQRRREMGIRLALGSSPAGIRALILKRAAFLGFAGITLGMIASIVLSTLLQGLVPGLNGGDPFSLAMAFAVLSLVTLAACAVPAWRASRVNPSSVLRT